MVWMFVLHLFQNRVTDVRGSIFRPNVNLTKLQTYIIYIGLYFSRINPMYDVQGHSSSKGFFIMTCKWHKWSLSNALTTGAL